MATIVVASLFRLEAGSVGDYQGTLGRNDWCGSCTWGGLASEGDFVGRIVAAGCFRLEAVLNT